MLKGTFPAVIDNTMRSAFVACPTKFFYAYSNHFQPHSFSIHLHAGIAFAKGIEVTRLAFYRDNKSASEAIALGYCAVLDAYGDADYGEDAIKTAERMASALNYYFTAFPLESDFVRPHLIANRPAVEFNFTVPLPINHPDTGEPLLYYGRFDMIGRDDSGTLYVVDEKTTGQLGPTWGGRYDLSSQFTGYCWGAKHFGIDISSVLIRGISILKTGHGHAQHIMYRPQWVIDRWYAQLLRDLTRMVETYRTNVWDMNLSDSCSSFGSCTFAKVCQTNEPELWLAGPDFVQRPYNPMEIK